MILSLSRPRGSPVVPVLVLAALIAAATGGYVAEAPNRLLSGRPIALWTAAGPYYAAGIAALGAALLATSLAPAGRRAAAVATALSAGLLLLLVAAVGHAASALAQGAPPAARIAPGAAFWVLFGCALLAALDGVQRAGAGVAAAAIAIALGGGIAALAAGGAFDALSIAREYAGHRAAFAAAVVRHLLLVVGSVVPAAAIGFPLGVAAARHPRLRGPLFAGLNLLQTVPSIALFGLLLVPLSAAAKAVPALAALGVGGVGVAPALIALVLYSLLPIVRNTATGLAGVDPAIVGAGSGMGMSPRQLFWQVELPLASPVLVSGLRIVTVQAVGLAVVAALIGAGGLGSFVFDGLGQYAIDLVLLGALPAIVIALAADLALQSAAAALRRRYRR